MGIKIVASFFLSFLYLSMLYALLDDLKDVADFGAKLRFWEYIPLCVFGLLFVLVYVAMMALIWL